MGSEAAFIHYTVWPSRLAPTLPFDLTFDWISSGTVSAGCLYETLCIQIHIQYIDYNLYRSRTVQIWVKYRPNCMLYPRVMARNPHRTHRAPVVYRILGA